MALSLTSNKRRCLETKRDLPSKPTENLHTPIMYDNKAFEAEVKSDGQQRHSHADTTRTGSADSHFCLETVKSIAIRDNHSNSPQKHETTENCPPKSTAAFTANGIGSIGETINNSVDISANRPPPVADKHTVLTHQQGSALERGSKKKSAPDQTDTSRQSRINNLPRRDSGIFLLSAPTELNISQDTFRHGQSHSHPVSRTSSRISDVSIQSASKGSLRSDMLM